MAALENGVSQIEDGAGRFPQVAGMSYGFDPQKPAGSRVHSVKIGGQPIDPEKTYGVVSNNYMRGGGDGYSVFAKNGIDAYDYGPNLEDAVAEYIAAAGSYSPYLDGRITVGAEMMAASEATPAAEAAPAATASGQTHVIMAGDTYWDLARKFYGDPQKWRMIDDANPEYRARGLVIGQSLNIPAAN